MINYDILSLITIMIVLCSAVYGFIELDGSFSLCELLTSLNVIFLSIVLYYFEKYKINIGEYGFNIYILKIILYTFVGIVVIATSSYGWIFSILCFLNVIVYLKEYNNIKSTDDNEVHANFNTEHEFHTNFQENLEENIEYNIEYNNE